MRPLTEEEIKIFFEKLSKYIGENIKLLLDRAVGAYCFRLHKDRVYYVSEKIMKQVCNNTKNFEYKKKLIYFRQLTWQEKISLHLVLVLGNLLNQENLDFT